MGSLDAETDGLGAHRFHIGALEIDPLTMSGALDRIEALVSAAQGGSVFTPNVDHVVMAETNERFRNAYAHADLCLVDGAPVLWASRLLRDSLPEKVSGSDLVMPMMERARERGWRVYLLGGQAGAARDAARVLRTRCRVNVVGTDDAIVQPDRPGDPDQREIVTRIRDAHPDLLLVALGAPKQEIWIDQNAEALRPAVALGVGASIDFLAGRVRRAPRWMSRLGLEWLYRLAHEPRRLWRRYLVNDPKFFAILLRELLRRLSRPALPPGAGITAPSAGPR